MTFEQRSRRESSVIARIRLGDPCGLGPYSVAMLITEALQQYRDILSIGFSSPNFVIGLNSPDIQLNVLYSRTIEGPGLILDMVPWCPEYENFDLPWIITPTDKVILPKQSASYMNNLICHGKPLEQYVSRLIVGQQGIASTSDAAARAGEIHISNLSGMGKGSCVPDFSYLMILELKEFYNAKFRAFRKCAQSCEELCDCAYQLSEDLNTALKSIDTHAQSIKNLPTQEMLLLISSFGEDIQSEALYMAEELIGIGSNICPLYDNMSSIVDLTSFKKKLYALVEDVPANYTSQLKIILNAVVQKIHGTSATVTSEATATGNFVTFISGQNCNEYYKSPPMITKDEAEADAIYRFLRHKTNVLGYNIVDLNYSTLANLVSEINKYNEQVNELLLCATKAAAMIDQVHKDISQMYEDLIQQVPRQEIVQLDTLIQYLLSSTETYSMAAEHGLNAFKENKQAYASIILQTKYRSTPAH